jgi:hypothetical protein
MKRIIIILPTYILFFMAPDIISACATCYGAPDTQATMGMNWAIITLLGVTGVVLGGVIKAIISIGNKTKNFQQLNKQQSNYP